MRPGRRAFFLPRVLSASPWAQFCNRLTRVISGQLEDETPAADLPGRARLTLGRDEDAYHARALCAEFNITLVQPGVPDQALPPERPWLRLDISRLSALESFDAQHGLLDARIGCLVGTVRERLSGTRWRWDGGNDDETLAQWLAGASGWLPGRCAESGLVSAEVMLAGGVFEYLGPFGPEATRALGSGASGQLVAGLFDLSTERDAQAMMALPAWPARYRLDALAPVATPHGPAPAPNPAHLLLGSGGTLAWPARLRLQARLADLPPALTAQPPEVDPRHAWRETPADRLDARVKSLFDPLGVFPS